MPVLAYDIELVILGVDPGFQLAYHYWTWVRPKSLQSALAAAQVRPIFLRLVLFVEVLRPRQEGPLFDGNIFTQQKSR